MLENVTRVVLVLKIISLALLLLEICFLAQHGPSFNSNVQIKILHQFNWWKKRKTKMPSAKKNAIDLTLKKNGMETVLHIKAAKEIEDFFKKASAKGTGSTKASTETSAKWLDNEDNGLVFYVKNEKLSNKVSRYGSVMDNFGNGLLDNDGRFNLAVLRIVGISSENGVTIKTDDLTGYQEIRHYIESVASWTKAFYEENLVDQEISASVSFEVE